MNNSITAQATEKAGACFSWIQKPGACFSWISENNDSNALQRPTVSLNMESIEAALK
ncbi:MAG: hypothetical protein AAFQ95_06970 [Cyanobacteria bacterium J06621_3]